MAAIERGLMIADKPLEWVAGVVSGCDLLRPWEFASMEDFLQQHAADVRAIAAMGSMTPARSVLERLPNLGLIACISTGYESVDVDWCRAHGVQVSTGAAANGNDVADQALGLLIAAFRKFTQGGAMVRTEGQWKAMPNSVRGRSLRGKKVGIIGMGRIGQAIARRLEACEMIVSWYGPNAKPQLAYPRAESVLALARDSDALVVAAPATPETQKIVDRQVIDALGPQGVIVNIARGALVDEDALIAALREGRLMAAGLDVFETEPTPAAKWADVPNVELMPHTAGSTPEGGQALTDRFAQNVRCFFAGEPLVSALF